MAEAKSVDQSQDDAPSGPSKTACRFCGKSSMVDAQATPDWLCASCERYQQQMACPTCHQPAIFSLLPPDVIPAPVAVED